MLTYVYDTYAKAKDGRLMHFDVIIPQKDDTKAIEYAKEWLNSIGQKEVEVTTKQCQFCHSEVASPEIEKEIQQKGYYIYKMEGCP